MRIKYAIPSYNRADGVLTLDYLSEAFIYVSPQDYPKYVKCNPKHADRIVAVPDGVQGKGKAHAMNYLLDVLWDDETDAIVFIDDDISTLMMHVKNGKDVERDEFSFYEICENYCRLAKEWGCGMWSFNLNSDPMTYDEFKPFRLHAYLDGGCQGIVQNDGLRYDEELTVKEDVDMFLQQIQKYHKALRVERYYLKKRSFEGGGGSQAFRSKETEQEQFKAMQKKWGSDIIRPNKPKATQDGGIRSLGGQSEYTCR